MDSGPPDDLEPPWRILSDGPEREGLQRRYDFEITEEHPLAGLGGEVISRCEANDDVLVRMSGGQLALVHLTWNEGNATCPHFVLCSAEDAGLLMERST